VPQQRMAGVSPRANWLADNPRITGVRSAIATRGSGRFRGVGGLALTTRVAGMCSAPATHGRSPIATDKNNSYTFYNSIKLIIQTTVTHFVSGQPMRQV